MRRSRNSVNAEADKAVETVAPDAGDTAAPDVAGLLRAALRTLSKA